MTVDISKIKTGDVIHVRLTVSGIETRYDNKLLFWVRENDHVVEPEDIVSIEPRPLSPGDRLRDRDGEEHTVHFVFPDGDFVTTYHAENGVEIKNVWSAANLSDWERL